MPNELIVKNGLKVDTTAGALILPVLTTTQRNALTPTAGFTIFNSTTATFQVYNGTAWNELIPIVLTSPTANQVLTYNGTNWVNQASYAAPSATLFNYYNFI